MSLLSVSARMYSLKESARRAVCARVSLLQYTSRAVCTERKRQLSYLRWDEFATVYQPSCFHWKKAPDELFALIRVYYSVLAELFALKESAKLFVLRWVYYSVPAELFALKESTSRAVCAEMSLLQCTSWAVCTERKPQPSCLRWDEFIKVHQPSCLHWYEFTIVY